VTKRAVDACGGTIVAEKARLHTMYDSALLLGARKEVAFDARHSCIERFAMRHAQCAYRRCVTYHYPTVADYLVAVKA